MLNSTGPDTLSYTLLTILPFTPIQKVLEVNTEVYGRSANFFGVVGMGNSDTGVGVAGVSDTGIGVTAQSDSGVPFQIVSGSQPATASGSLQAGMMYTDGDRNLYIWAKGSNGNTFG